MNDPDLFSGLFIFVLLSMLGSLALFATNKHRQTIRFQLRLFMLAFALRFAASIAIYQFGFVQVLKDEDASGWLRGGHFYRLWTQQGVGILDLPSVLSGVFQTQHSGYYYLVGTLFYLTDSPARLPAAALNCFFGALTVVFAYRIARSLFSEYVAVRVGWWVCLFPSMIFWSAQTLKEPVVIILETLALYGCVRLKLSGFSLRHLLLSTSAIILVIPFRFYAAYIAGAAVMLSLLLPQIGKRKITIGAAVLILALVIPILVVSGVLVQQEAQLEKFDLQQVQKFRENVSVGYGSGVKSDYDLGTPDGFVLGTLVGAAHLMLAPFPWQLSGGSLRMWLTLPDVAIWWWLFFFGFLPGLWHARHRFNDIQPLLFFIFGLGLLYSLMFGNIGLAYRQRAQLLPWLLIFAAVGLEQRAIKRLAAQRARGHAIARGQEVASSPKPPLDKSLPGSRLSTQLNPD